MTNSTLAPANIKFESDEDSSRSKIEVLADNDAGYISNTFDVYASADSADEQVYLSVRQHTYAHLNGFEAVTTRNTFVEQHFSREEAEAIVKALSAELARF